MMFVLTNNRLTEEREHSARVQSASYYNIFKLTCKYYIAVYIDGAISITRSG